MAETKYEGRSDALIALLKIETYLLFLWSKKIIILIGAITISLLMFFRTLNSEASYSAKLTYMVNDDTGKGAGDVGALLGQFGLGTGVASEYNLDKIIELSKSTRIIYSAILDSIKIDNRVDLVGNFIIEKYNLHEKWEEIEHVDLDNVNMRPVPIDSLSLEERTALKILYLIIVGENKSQGMLNSSVRDNTGVLSIEVNTNNEELTLGLSKSIYEKLSIFYIDKSIEKQLATYNFVKEKVDSIAIELSILEYQLADIMDQASGFFLMSDKMKQQRLVRKVQFLSTMYGEALKNRETSLFLVSKSTPFFQVIDFPIFPLQRKDDSKFRSLILGACLGGVVTIILFILIKLVREVMDVIRKG
jgi:hypothetical protein